VERDIDDARIGQKMTIFTTKKIIIVMQAAKPK
jgi:hypothetical protein